jgi:SAM-dependent methyltransferase
VRPTLTPRTITTYLNDATILEFLEHNLPRLTGTVLDIGCGTMRYRDTVLSGTGVQRYIGLDLEAGKYAYAVKADAYWDGVRMPLDDESIDGAILFEVLEHCEDPRIVVSEALRVLKPGGVLLFSTPFVYPLHGVPYDFQRLTPAGASSLLVAAGFAPVEIEAGGAWDASLGQMMSVWIAHRPMPRIVRMALAVVHAPVFGLLLALDRRQRRAPLDRENRMLTGVLGRAWKPR